jgi:uncharacterized protein YkwD
MHSLAARFLCFAGFVLLAGLSGLSPAVASAAAVSGSGHALSALDEGIFTRLNAIRVAHGLVPLTPNGALASAATSHNAQMIEDGYFGHDSAHGAPFQVHIERYYAPTGYSWWAVGENLLWSPSEIDAGRAVSAWMASAEHRANILDARWREVGIAAIQTAAAPGASGRFPATVITADFGVRN